MSKPNTESRSEKASPSKWTETSCPTCGAPRATVNGDWLRARRLAYGLTLKQVSERMGCSMPYLSDVERGQRRCTTRLLTFYETLGG